MSSGDPPAGGTGGILKNPQGWDGKLRVGKAVLKHQPKGESDDEASEDEQEEFQPEQISADEDLLEDFPLDAEDIDLVHRRIQSIPALDLERFKSVERICLRQNAITRIEFPDCICATVKDLDLYDNLIGHLKGLDNAKRLTSLDLSFNKLKHIKNISHMTELRDLYFVQNRITTIEGLETLTKLRNLELAANRIREIENLDQLQSLEELWLGKNKITQIRNLDALTTLRVLSLPANRLTAFSGLESLVNLEELYVSDNALTSLEGLEKNVKLRVLDISSNHVANLSHLDNHTALEEFWASSNEISSYKEVEGQLGSKANLETVYFEDNPLQRQSAATYRNKVRMALPQIKQIDATYVRTG